MMTGLDPRGFTWVIAGRLAVSERIGGYGFQHRRVRREEEIAWLQHRGINALLSLLDGNQNLASYEAAGITFGHQPLIDLEAPTVTAVFEAIHEMLGRTGTSSMTRWRVSWPGTWSTPASSTIRSWRLPPFRRFSSGRSDRRAVA